MSSKDLELAGKLVLKKGCDKVIWIIPRNAPYVERRVYTSSTHYETLSQKIVDEYVLREYGIMRHVRVKYRMVT